VVYNAVLAAHTAVIGAMRPGASWADMHLLANRTILAHLLAAGLLAGEVEEMMGAWVGALFMPHGG
jgi:Xaa-Pro dipeptidase